MKLVQEKVAVTGKGDRIKVSFLESPADGVLVRVDHPDGTTTTHGPWTEGGEKLSKEDGIRRGQCEAEDYLSARYGLAAWER